MPRHNRPDLAQGLRRKYATDPPGAFDTISGEIVPVEIVGLLQEESSAGLRACGGDIIQAAVAAQYGTMGLVNPGGSGVLCEVYLITGMCSSGSTYYRVSISDAISGVITGLTLVDSHFLESPSTGHPSARFYIGTQAGATVFGRSIRVIFITAGWPGVMEFDPPIILKPGGQVVLCNTTVNQVAPMTMLWRERVLPIDVS